MKGFLIFVIGVLAAVAFFKWDAIVDQFHTISQAVFGNISSHDRYGGEEPVSDEERALLADEWQNGGRARSVERLNRMKQALDSKLASPGYHYAKSLANEARSAIIKFERAIGHDDYIAARHCDSKATEAIQRFEMNCRWRPGVSKGAGTHLHSGSQPGTWEPDNGYVLMNGRAVQIRICGHCKGSGSVRVQQYCSACNGRGRVANPAAQVTGAIDMAAGIAGMFGGRQAPRIQTPRVPSEITCSSCNGRGQVQGSESCSACGGQGKLVYE